MIKPKEEEEEETPAAEGGETVAAAGGDEEEWARSHTLLKSSDYDVSQSLWWNAEIVIKRVNNAELQWSASQQGIVYLLLQLLFLLFKIIINAIHFSFKLYYMS